MLWQCQILHSVKKRVDIPIKITSVNRKHRERSQKRPPNYSKRKRSETKEWSCDSRKLEKRIFIEFHVNDGVSDVKHFRMKEMKKANKTHWVILFIYKIMSLNVCCWLHLLIHEHFRNNKRNCLFFFFECQTPIPRIYIQIRKIQEKNFGE